MHTWATITSTDNSRTTILIRLMVGAVFLSEGIQKFLYPDKLGVGRFLKIGIPSPDFFGPLIGSLEIISGLLILIGLITRIAAIPLLSIMIVALITTKLKLLNSEGLWFMLHESRTDWSMFLGCIFLIIRGGGYWSLDRFLWKNQREKS